MNNPIKRTIHPEIKAIDAGKGIFDVTASDQTLDHDKEIVLAAGWKFTYFQKNSPLVDSHNSYTIANCLGKVVDFAVTDGKLVERIQWAVDVAENTLAIIGCKMMAAGYLKAFSVGFKPIKYLTQSSGKEWTDMLATLKVPAGTDIRCIYVEQEQVELSVCILGANPNALVKMQSEGVLTAAECEKICPPPAVRNKRLGDWADGVRRRDFVKTLQSRLPRS